MSMYLVPSKLIGLCRIYHQNFVELSEDSYQNNVYNINNHITMVTFNNSKII